MSLTKRLIDGLIDLVEIKLSYMQIIDREDAREQTTLESCLHELQEIRAMVRSGTKAIAFATSGNGSGRQHAKALP